MAQPTEFPDWATNDRTWPVPGAPDPDNKERPATSIITDGYAPSDSTEGDKFPLARNINYQFNLLGLWTRYLTTANVGDNLAIGGNFDTNPWQRQTLVTGVTGSGYDYRTADRFAFGQALGAAPMTAVIDNDRVALSPSVSESGIFVQNSFRLKVDTAQPVLPDDFSFVLLYFMEGYDFAQIAQRNFTISFWVYATQAGKYSIGLSNDATDTQYIAPYIIDAPNTWQKIEINVTPSPDNGGWDYENGRGLIINFTLAEGSDYFGTNFNSWETGAVRSNVPSDHVNFLDTANNEFIINLFKIEPRPTATEWEFRSAAKELHLCQRYYEKSLNIDEYPGVIQPGVRGYELIHNATTNDIPHIFRFNTRKRPGSVASGRPIRVIPYSDVTGTPYTVRNFSGGADFTPITPNIGDLDAGVSETNFNLETNVTANDTQTFYWTADSELR